jgi:hypothetical protein
MSDSRTALVMERIRCVKQNFTDELDLSSLGLKTLPTALGELTNLRKLDISGNQFQELPMIVLSLHQLEELDAGNNRIEQLQSETEQLTQLVVLDLSENRLSLLPPQIGNLTRMRALRLYSNRLSTLPKTILNLQSLVELDIAKNILFSLPPLDAHFSNLRHLDLSCNNLQSIPDGLNQLTGLRRLDLSNNKISTVGIQLASLHELEELYLDNNNLQELSLDITKLPFLWALSVEGNPIHQLPPSFKKVDGHDLRKQASDSIGKYIWVDRPEGDFGLIEPEIVFGFLLAVGGIPGVLSIIDLYYKHFREDCSVKLTYPNGTGVYLQRLSRKKAMKIAQQHEQLLKEGKVLIDLEKDTQRIRGDAKKRFAVDVISRVGDEVELLPKQQDAPPVLFRRANPHPPTQREGEATMISIMFVAADPSDAARLRLGEEAREIQEKLQLAKARDFFTFNQRWSVRPEDLTQALIDVQPQIVHFSGHGMSTGALCLEDQQGNILPVEPDALTALFELVADQVQCVVLNACYSEIQANSIATHIPYVIGMNQAIGDKAAIAFAVGFYQALGGRRSIEDAYKFGCVQIRLQGISEHLTPVLVKKSNNAADGA